ncbi:MAG: PKD domain-containing protein [Chloroflexi bacterium]|nr:PKD domain-containing protein [Chloroflexota bacterium]
MRRIVSVFLLSIFIIGLLLVVGSHQQPSVAAFTTSGVGAAQISGSIQLDLSLSATVVQPGDTIDLMLTLSNPGQMTQMPEIILQLPQTVAPASRLLPAGMTINMMANEISWLPIVSANGGLQQFALQLRADTADILQPNQAITAVTHLNGETYNAAAGFWLGIPPQIDTVLAPPQVAIGQPFSLHIETSGSGPITQSWQFDDGRQVDVNDPTIVYPAAGIYQITVNAENPLTAVSATKTITVVPHPAAQFAVTDLTISSSQALQLINESGGQSPLTYQWNFGDGNISNEANPEHVYAAPGVYQVHLAVENEYGSSDAFAVITVGQPPIAEIVLPESIPANQSFTGQAFGDDSVTHFQWNMGDGNMQEGTQISHSYRGSGDYYVVMRANNEFGGTDIGRWIHVDLGNFLTYLPLILQSLVSDISTGAGEHSVDDGLGITLPEVALDEPFVLRPLPLPASMTQAEQLLVYVNEVRAQFDLPSLTNVAELNNVAQQHTDDMAAFAYTAHVGSDGSFPVERFIWLGYAAGYAGEATAWGFEYPYQAVEFWVNSPAHRRIILNEYATDLGVGYTRDFTAPNIWYWTAEFGNAFLSPPLATLHLSVPDAAQEFLNSDVIAFGWNWPQSLTSEQEFVVSIRVDGEEFEIGRVSEPRLGTYFALETDMLVYPDVIGEVEWYVTLKQGVTTVVETELRTLFIVPDPTLPTPTPETADAPPATITPVPTVTATPHRVQPSPTPSNPVLPPLLTATPNP